MVDKEVVALGERVGQIILIMDDIKTCIHQTVIKVKLLL